MVEFAAVLAEVAAREPAWPRLRDFATFAARASDGFGAGARCVAPSEVAAAYGAHEPTPTIANRPPERATLARAFRQAKGDAPRLRRLRRRIAWALHPDRAGAGDAALLAEFNADIDAALRRLSQKRG